MDITYDKNVRKRSWSKADQASQTLAKPWLTRNKVMLCVWWDWKGIIHYSCYHQAGPSILNSTANN
ncbi:hypothetical protein F3G12_18765 [Acinetobacter baumannii]|nr:hypothetical protein F3G12_18765 [Acinetobacter baumannii]